jgi:hypothetical protein
VMHTVRSASFWRDNPQRITGESNMSKRQLLALLLGLSVFSMGCGAGMAVTAREREAFVVRAGMFKSFVYRCTAENPSDPICVRVNERR